MTEVSSGEMEGIEGFNPVPSSWSNYRVVEESMEPSAAECEAYERYLHLPELRAMWRAREWAAWPSEPLLKPALQALEMTFRLLSAVLCDSRAYVDKSEWGRRIESLAGSQLELISTLLEGDAQAPTVQLWSAAGRGVVGEGEVWQRPGASPVVSRTSKQSLLPRLGTWKTAQDIVARIWLAIECHMHRAPFTLGIGEPNLAGKPVLEYDGICRPGQLYSFLRQSAQASSNGGEAHAVCTVHQILEAWLFAAQELVKRVHRRTDRGDARGAAGDCWMLERVWKLLTETEHVLLLVDPDDFLRLARQLAVAGAAYCLRSGALRNVSNACKELRDLVPKATGVLPDPKGGPRLQEALMHLFHSHAASSTIHLLQAFQAVEAAVKRFFFAYQQLVIVVMGSVEAKGSPSDALSLIYFEPPYFPSVDAAKTFLADYWHYGPAAAPAQPRFQTVQQPTILP